MRQGPSIRERESRQHAQPQSACFVCGQDNARGLRLEFRPEFDGGMTANWMPDSAFEGFHGVIHGGVVSTVLDEAMSKAVAATGAKALTAELRVRFRHHVATGEDFRVRGWIVGRHKRVIDAEAALTAADGTEHAHAWAKFLSLPGAGH
jgi:acyl-coenzyme A thioesterase PaaI-like protein